MKKPKNLDFKQLHTTNGSTTHDKGKAKFEGTFKHPGNTGCPKMGAGAKKFTGR